MSAAMACKTSLCRRSRETCSTIGEHKTKYACIVEGDESMRTRMEGAPHRYHEDHISGKGMNSISHYNLVRQSSPMPQAMKIPDAKAAVEKWRIFAWSGCRLRSTPVVPGIVTVSVLHGVRGGNLEG